MIFDVLLNLANASYVEVVPYVLPQLLCILSDCTPR